MKTVLNIKNLSVFYKENQALKNINLEVKEKDFLGIIGPNGGGKTTLIKAMLGMLPNHKGEVELFGKKIKNYKNVGYVPQISNLEKDFPITVLEVVMTAFVNYGLKPFKKYTEEEKNVAIKKLKLVGIEHLKEKQISELSGGEFQRLLIARALACDSSILILDEPTANVDPSSRDIIYKLLEKLNKDITIIMVTHDLLAISEVVKNIACLNVELVYHGKPSLTENIIEKLYGCPVDLVAHGVAHRVLKEHGDENDWYNSKL